MKTLVYLETHDGELTKPGLGVLSKVATLGGDVAGVVLGSGVREAAAGAGAYGATTVYVVDDDALASPLPQARVDALAAVVAESGADTVVFPASVLSADVAAGLSARLDAGLNWDLTDLRVEGEELVGVRPALGDTVVAGPKTNVAFLKRLCEAQEFRRGAFDTGFIELARSVYRENDDRARIKREINLALGSAYVEEKSYQDYRPPQS